MTSDQLKCQKCLDLLQDYLDGDLNGSAADEVRDHLDHCPICSEEYSALLKMSRLFQEEEIEYPSEYQWQKTWQEIEAHLAAPKVYWWQEIWMTIDYGFHRMLNPHSSALRLSYSLGLFIGGIFLGSILMNPDLRVSSKIVKLETQTLEVPVVQKEEVVKYLDNQVASASKPVSEKVVVKPKVIYVANAANFEPAPVFPMNDSGNSSDEKSSVESSAKTEPTRDIWEAKFNVDHTINAVKKELDVTFANASYAEPSY